MICSIDLFGVSLDLFGALRRVAKSDTRRALLAAATLLPIAGSHVAGAQAVTLVPNVVKFAGTGAAYYSGDFGSSNFVALNSPSAVVLDSAGAVYITDTGNSCIRRVDAATNAVTTVAGLVSGASGDTCNAALNPTPTAAQGLAQPQGIAIDSFDNLYVADTGHNCVRMLPAHSIGTSNMVTVAGTCTAINASATVTTPGSTTPRPAGVLVDNSNHLFISIRDTPDSIYQVLRHTGGDATTALCRVAGDTAATVSTICAGYTALPSLVEPAGLALGPLGDLYIADGGNNCIRKQSAGATTTAVGTCANDSTTSGSPAIAAPSGLLFLPTGELIFSSGAQNQIFRVTFGTNTVLRLAGYPTGVSGTYDSLQNGIGSQSIPLNTPAGLALSSNGDFYLAEQGNSIVRRFRASNTFASTAVGNASTSQLLTFTINNDSVNLSAHVGPEYVIDSNSCAGPLTAAAAGSLSKSCTMAISFHPSLPGERFSPLRLTDAVSTTSVTTGLQGIGESAQPLFTPGQANTFATAPPHAIATTVNSAGDVVVLSGDGTAGTVDIRVLAAATGTPTVLPSSGLVAPSAIAIDAAENLYVTDKSTGKVVKFGSDGTVNTSYISGLTAPTAIAVASDGSVLVAEGGAKHDVVRYLAGGESMIIAGAGTTASANNVPATAALFQLPSSIAITSDGNTFIADSAAHLVYVIDINNLIHVFAGNGGTATTTPGTALGTAFVQPSGLAVDAAGDLFIADPPSNTVSVVYSATLGTSNVSTLIGTGTAGNTGDGGLATLATVNAPLAVGVAGNGNIFVVDSGNTSIRSITFPAPTIDFGTVGLGGTATAAQTIWNRGNEAFVYNADFVMTNPAFSNDASFTTCGPSVEVGETCNFGFAFTASTNGTQTGDGSLYDTVYNAAQIVHFKATVDTPLITAFTAAPESHAYGHAYIGTVNVTTNNGPVPTGTVTFTINGTVVCSVTGNINGTVTCTLPSDGLAVGTYPVVVSYTGDSNYPAPHVTHTTLTVTRAPITVTVDAKNKSVGAANPTLTGTMQGVVTGDTVSVTYSTTADINSPAGDYPITAALAFTPTTLSDNYSVTIVPAVLHVTYPTAMVLTSSINPGVPSQNITFTAALTPSNAPGTVTFYDGATVLCTPVNIAGGVATCSTTSLALGTHTITAIYAPASTLYQPVTETFTQSIAVPSGSFTISVTPISQYIVGPGTTTYPVTITSQGGFSGDVKLLCSGLPSDAGCTFTNAVLTVPAGGTVTTAMNITTSNNDARMAPPALPFHHEGTALAPLYVATTLPMGLSSFGVLLAGIRRRRKVSRLLMMAFLAFAALGIAGCGCPVNSLQNYSVTVTASSVLGGPPDASATVQLTVATSGSN